MKGIDRKIRKESKSSIEGKIRDAGEKRKFEADSLLRDIQNMLRKRIILSKGLICAIILLSFLFSGKTAGLIKANDTYYSETVTACETIKQGFDFKTSILISIGLGASFSIVHMDKRKTQKYS